MNERAQFELWFSETGLGYGGDKHAAWKAWQARAALAASPAPAGWKLVPVEPTLDMNRAARVNMEYRSCTPAEIWAAMLAAAPTMLNGLTESETLATASVAGLSAPAQQAEALDDMGILRLAERHGVVFQDDYDNWCSTMREDADLSPELLEFARALLAATAPSVEAQADKQAPHYYVQCLDCCAWKRVVAGNHHPWCGCGSDRFNWGDERKEKLE